MVILLLLGAGLIWYGRRVTAQHVTDEERKMRTGALVRSMLSRGPDGLLPVIGGMMIQACGLLILFSSLLP
jgi:hypothetical protein